MSIRSPASFGKATCDKELMKRNTVAATSCHVWDLASLRSRNGELDRVRDSSS